MKYLIEYSPEAGEHLRALSARDRVTVLDSVDAQLSRQPLEETRNRKPMRPNPVAPWEFRIGYLRVYYDVMMDPRPTVVVVAIGVKRRNRIRIGREVVEL